MGAVSPGERAVLVALLLPPPPGDLRGVGVLNYPTRPEGDDETQRLGLCGEAQRVWLDGGDDSGRRRELRGVGAVGGADVGDSPANSDGGVDSQLGHGDGGVVEAVGGRGAAWADEGGAHLE